PLRLFNPRARIPSEMFLLQAGDRVRFTETDASETSSATTETELDSSTAEPNLVDSQSHAFLKVADPGVGLSIQDGGRYGWLRFGVPSSGMMDPYTAGWANRLVGSLPGAPVLELCLQGQRFEVLADGWLAFAGGAQGMHICGSSNRKSNPLVPWSTMV